MPACPCDHNRVNLDRFGFKVIQTNQVHTGVTHSPGHTPSHIQGDDRASSRRRSKSAGRKRKHQKSSKCKKQRYRDYFIEGGCRSRKPFKMARCVAPTSGSMTCTATRVKKRKIKMVCKDGRKYRKEVEMVKRCGNRKQRDQPRWG